MKRIVLFLLTFAVQMQLGFSALAQEAPPAPPLGPWKSRTEETPPVPSAAPVVTGDDGYIVAAGVLLLVIAAGVVMFAILRSAGGRQRESHPVQAKAPESASAGTPERRTMAPTVARQKGKRVFISYRRGDSADITGRIYDRLVQHFGKDCIFKDVDSIPLGIDFRQHLQSAVGQCSVLLAIIGKGWLEAETESGGRRLDDARDYLKIEIETALKREIPVIPVLVQGASVPPEHDLPPSLQGLAFRNALAVRTDPDFHVDMDRLIRGIEAHLK